MDYEGRGKHGFTIVELLIVIVIIGILAAITVVAYRGITAQATAATIKDGLNSAQKALETYGSVNDAYPPDLATVGVSSSNGIAYQYSYNNAVNPRTWCVTATSGSTSYYLSNTAVSAQAGGCSGHGVGGSAPITNLAVNPSAGVSTAGWNVVSPAGSTSTASNPSVGGPGVVSSFYRRTFTTAATQSPFVISSISSGTASLPVAAGQVYTMSVYVRSSCDLSNGFRLDITEFDNTGAQVGTTIKGSNANGSSNTWLHLVEQYTVSSGISFAQPRPTYSGETGCSVGSTFDATGMMITQGSTTYNYADGNSPGWVWNGTPGNATSTGPAL